MRAKSWLIWIVGGVALLLLPGIEGSTQGGGASHFQCYVKPLPLPDFSLKDLQGKMVQIKDYRGKVILLNFWATW
jgi:cytochrome oxidase Cu insertion factor (SCO1/SenC/PrrC family)